MSEFDTLTTVLDEIDRLRDAHDILCDVWTDCGAYGEHKLSDETVDKIKRHFKFDDSE